MFTPCVAPSFVDAHIGLRENQQSNYRIANLSMSTFILNSSSKFSHQFIIFQMVVLQTMTVSRVNQTAFSQNTGTLFFKLLSRASTAHDAVVLFHFLYRSQFLCSGDSHKQKFRNSDRSLDTFRKYRNNSRTNLFFFVLFAPSASIFSDAIVTLF